MLLIDKLTIPSKRIYTDSGMLQVPCVLARTGVQQYTADSLGLEGGSKIIDVHREESEVFNDESLSTYRSCPMTSGHPVVDGKAVLVTTKNSKSLQVGFLEGNAIRDEDHVTGNLVVSNADAIENIEQGTVELSMGYTCDIDDRNGTLYQTNIRINHVALVEKGRAGSSCRISDEDNTNQEELMTNKETKEAVKVEDKKEEPVVTIDSLTVDMDVLQAKLDASVALVDSMKAEATEAEKLFIDKVEAAVTERTNVISIAKDLTDLDDFSGKTVEEIKALVVADKLSIDLADKSPEYIQARLDILVEDKALVPTKLADAMEPEVKEVKQEVVVDAVEAARNAMIERHSNKGAK